MLSRAAHFAKLVILSVRTGCVLVLLCLGANVIAGPAKPVDRILVEKSKRTMALMSGSEVLKSYKVALGRQPIGAKDRQGDHKTPEGIYVVDAKIPDSQFHKALHISYPNSMDRERARMLGVSPGGDVEIHGLGKHWGWVGSLHRLMDWTDGCIAVTDQEIDEIYPLIRVGTIVEIRP
ncbi:MAG TPA: L,D-transpeptidase family protein [Candidatus Sulfotelmatobacter sp.]|nr:L,D-transpeptidase family protein [Candidatus Sulfotelmatobacter sp.]